MSLPFSLLVLLIPVFFILPFTSSSSSSSPLYTLSKGSSLSVEDTQTFLISRNNVFSAGFYEIGQNAFCFSIWYTKQTSTIVWMANRDNPVNGKQSKLSLSKTGNLVLNDAGIPSIWSTGTSSNSAVQLQINDTGNLVLYTVTSTGAYNVTLWQSFDLPTDTLLPNQPLTENTRLVSSRSSTNYSSGFYQLFFNDDNLLSLVFNGVETASVYWPDNNGLPWEIGRSTYNDSRIAVLDSSGYFLSSDEMNFTTADYGIGPMRRLVLDSDGNLRVYSLEQDDDSWHVQWLAFLEACEINGVCGPNSLCTYEFDGRKCVCVPGYTLIDDQDWSTGCEPVFEITCEQGMDTDDEFVQLQHVEFVGDHSDQYANYTFDECTSACLSICSCVAFQFVYDDGLGYYQCNTRSVLLNGYKSVSVNDSMYIKLPKSFLSTNGRIDLGTGSHTNLSCSANDMVQLDRTYKGKHENGSVKFIFWFTCAFGGLEVLCVMFYIYKSRQPTHTNTAMQSYHQVATGFKRFSYSELKRASRNFKEEIGRGGGGVVYKAVLADQRVAAIKRLDDADQGEEEFLAEVSIIGRLNHMNLIEIWGYCAEGKHRLLVYEYMKHGSLAEQLYSNSLDWEKRYNIALGTAKGLAYLHEECLEWVLHCDVKPQNVLLDSNYQPKVADFGLSKLLNRGATAGGLSFSRIRGTRGYMAPEWVYNLSITSKVDVYSFGIVMMELITGKNPTEQRGLVGWVKEKMNGVIDRETCSWIEEIVDPNMKGGYDTERMEMLVHVAIKCTEEDKEARPTMSWVVDMLLPSEKKLISM